jgi:hypothetical protein
MSLAEAQRKFKLIQKRSKRNDEIANLRRIANETALWAKRQGPILNKQERLEAAVREGRFYLPVSISR